MNYDYNPMSEIFRHLTNSLVFMFIGFLIGLKFIPPSFVFFANTVLLILITLLLILCLCSRKGIIPRKFSMKYVYLYTFIDGILMYPIFAMYLKDLGTNIVLYVLIGTIAIFATLANTAKKKEAGHYLHLGPSLFKSLVVLIIFTIIGFFITNNVFDIVLSVAGIAIFSGYILYDVSLIKTEIENGSLQCTEDLSIHVLNLYLDFINIFLDLLSLISSIND